jgi:hypothetical protein
MEYGVCGAPSQGLVCILTARHLNRLVEKAPEKLGKIDG